MSKQQNLDISSASAFDVMPLSLAKIALYDTVAAATACDILGTYGHAVASSH